VATAMERISLDKAHSKEMGLVGMKPSCSSIVSMPLGGVNVEH
jgi:hypothetical protein